jgi:hypothetical protein
VEEVVDVELAVDVALLVEVVLEPEEEVLEALAAPAPPLPAEDPWLEQAAAKTAPTPSEAVKSAMTELLIRPS